MTIDDDKRAAAGLLSNLSGFIVSACLAMLAIEGALLTFVVGNRVAPPGYFVMSVLAFFAFVSSIVCGGRGITKTAEALAKGQWVVSIASGTFNAQAGLAFLGLICFLISALLVGAPKETEIQKSLTELTVETQALQAAMKAHELSDGTVVQDIKQLGQRVEKLEHALNKCAQKPKSSAKRPPSSPSPATLNKGKDCTP